MPEETFTVYLGVDNDGSELQEKLAEALDRVWELGGAYNDDCLEVTVTVKYCPEDK